ncbi:MULTISPECIES: hypothetical protein [unclassified Micromonospora]|uniref:hypothetical protein n=1 Tax=unclassified Micromonospora TaxID=2617518 RepID=UPI002FEFA219
MSPSLPLLVTDLRRGNLTDQPGIAAAVEEGVRRDGSSTGSLFVEEAGWRTEKSGWARRTSTTTVRVGANAAARIGRVLQGRLPFGRGLLVEAQDGGVGFRPGERFSVSEAGNGLLEIEVPPAVLTELIQVLRPMAGTYRLASAPELLVEIVRSQIRDQEGAVVAEIG